MLFILYSLYYRLGQKSKPGYCCNNFVYFQPIFITFGTCTTLGNLQQQEDVYKAHLTQFVKLHYLVKSLSRLFLSCFD